MPRGVHHSQGLSTTRWPVSSRRATASWPSTWGNETSAVSGLSREPFRKICFASEPHRPLMMVSHLTQPAAGGTGSGTCFRLTGAYFETKARLSTRPPIVAAASLARLCSNTNACTGPPSESGAT